jgi:hypothetical protein
MFTPDNFATWIRGMIAGTYVYRLTVTDDNGQSDFDDVTITVKGVQASPPVADAGKDFNVWLPYSGVLDGTSSKASNGSQIVKYSWSKVAGPGQFNIVSPNVVGSWINSLVSGSYTFRLTVTDNNGLSSTDDVVVTVRYANAMSNSGNDNGLIAAEPGAGDLNVAGSNKINIFPNPVVSSLNLKWTGDIRGAAKINIVNAEGKTVKTISMRKEQTDYYTSIDVSSLVPGIYIIQIQSQHGKPLHQQFLKR